MKQLESVKLVQFYLYENEDVKIGRHTGIFGPNGSGKSTLLDAIQVAIMGGNTNLISLNAQADEKHMTRSLRAYCLGQYGDAPEDRVREGSTTYITLIWRDTATGAVTSTGVCIEASADQEKHTVVGRYVLRDIELSMSDHLQTINGVQHPREWAVFRQALLQRSKAPADTCIFPDSEKYLRQMLLALRGGGGLPSTDAFTRALRFGLRMSFKKTVDEIVRYDVLEPRPTNIKQFKEVTDSFRRLSRLVAEVEAKINEGNKVIEEFDKAASEHDKSVTWTALSFDAAMETSNEEAERAIAEHVKKEERSATTEIALGAARTSLSEVDEKIGHLRSLRESHSAHQDHRTLSRDIDNAKRSQHAYTADLMAQVTGIRTLMLRSVQAPDLSNFKDKLQAEAGSLSTILSSSLPQRTVLATSLMAAFGLLKECGDELFNVNRRLHERFEELSRQVVLLEDEVARAATGKASLREDVRELLRQLRNNGLNPVPVCDVVRIKDIAWQPVIEAFLSTNREALLVRESEEAKAFSVYRQTQNLYGVKLARESSQNTALRAVPGSVAALIEGDDPAAVAYLRSKFGDVRCAETNEEALTGPRALTKDGMLVSRGEIDRLKPLRTHEFKIGITADNQGNHLRQQLDKLKIEKSALEDRLRTSDALLKELVRAGGADKVEQILNTYDRIRFQEQTHASLERKLSESASEEYVKLGIDLSNAEQQAIELRKRVETLASEFAVARSELETANRQKLIAQEKASDAASRAQQARTQTGYVADFAAAQWSKLLEAYGERYDEIRDAALNRSRDSATNRDKAIRYGLNALQSFVITHREQVGRELMADWLQASTWIRELIERLNSTDLVEQKARMDEAYRASQETFRTDVAIALNNHIEWLDLSMARLNKALKQCPTFSNGERYQFSRTLRSHLKPLLNFIQNIASNGAADDLFGGPGEMPTEFKELLEERIAPGAAGTKSPLDDYREFFEFEIDILREDPETGKAKTVGKLSKRLGSGSGGEHRAPLYVIAGAALASAYKLDDGHRDGMGLILLDEAFNKMDITNITATMRYLEDIGLQVVLASPGENLGILTAFLHRYYEILRDPVGNAVDLEGHWVSEETRLAYRSDLPEFHPELVEAELRNIMPPKSPDQLGEVAA